MIRIITITKLGFQSNNIIAPFTAIKGDFIIQTALYTDFGYATCLTLNQSEYITLFGNGILMMQ